MAQADQSLDGLSSEERKKVQALMQKDAKAERRVRGPWLWMTSLLGAAMVLIYFYGAGVQALDTQYHPGVYVLITFVLVFLLYPACGRFAVGTMSVGPALLYFLSVFFMVHFEAKKHGLVGIQGEEIPHWKQVLKGGWFYALPLVIITVLMLMGRSPGNAAFWATLSCILVSWVHPSTRMGPRAIWEAIQLGARNTLIIGATLGVIGIIVGVISLTGMGLKFSDLVISMAGDSLFLALVLIALASLVLGMGVPVTAAYLIVAVLAVPALGHFGVAAIAAHMIVYWLSQDSNITPPVCVAAYAGAAIAGSDPWKTGWTSFRFAKMLYVMPLLFAYVPAILLDGTAGEIFSAFFSATLGTIAFGAFAMGFLRRTTTLPEWLLLGGGTFLLYWPSLVTDGLGLAVVALVWWLQRDAAATSSSPAAKA